MKKITEAHTKIIPIKNGFAEFNEKIRLPLTPMIGVLGVAPAEGSVHCAVPGDHGSNMDTKLIKVGSKVYLPVFVSGANLALGDLHACMGDGELSGTGIETAGRVCLQVEVIKDRKLARPMLETPDAVYTLASRADIQEAIQTAVHDMVEFLMLKKELDFADAYRLLSAACDIQISQLVNDNITVRVKSTETGSAVGVCFLKQQNKHKKIKPPVINRVVLFSAQAVEACQSIINCMRQLIFVSSRQLF